MRGSGTALHACTLSRPRTPPSGASSKAVSQQHPHQGRADPQEHQVGPCQVSLSFPNQVHGVTPVSRQAPHGLRPRWAGLSPQWCVASPNTGQDVVALAVSRGYFGGTDSSGRAGVGGQFCLMGFLAGMRGPGDQADMATQHSAAVESSG